VPPRARTMYEINRSDRPRPTFPSADRSSLATWAHPGHAGPKAGSRVIRPIPCEHMIRTIFSHGRFPFVSHCLECFNSPNKGGLFSSFCHIIHLDAPNHCRAVREEVRMNTTMEIRQGRRTIWHNPAYPARLFQAPAMRNPGRSPVAHAIVTSRGKSRPAPEVFRDATYRTARSRAPVSAAGRVGLRNGARIQVRLSATALSVVRTLQLKCVHECGGWP